MKQFNTIALLTCFLVLGLFSCQKELHFLEPAPVSLFTVDVDGKTYNLDITTQSVTLKDTSHVRINASAPEISVSLNFMSETHQDGKGNYFLRCCSNDVFDRTKGPQKHWEIDHIGGGLQYGSVIINRMDENGYEGSYTIFANDYDISRTAKKEFKGKFVVVY